MNCNHFIQVLLIIGKRIIINDNNEIKTRTKTKKHRYVQLLCATPTLELQ